MADDKIKYYVRKPPTVSERKRRQEQCKEAKGKKGNIVVHPPTLEPVDVVVSTPIANIATERHQEQEEEEVHGNREEVEDELQEQEEDVETDEEKEGEEEEDDDEVEDLGEDNDDEVEKVEGDDNDEVEEDDDEVGELGEDNDEVSEVEGDDNDEVEEVSKDDNEVEDEDEEEEEQEHELPNDGWPQNRSLLKSFDSHVAYQIWNSHEDERGPLKPLPHWRKLNDWDLDQECKEVRDFVGDSGLLNLAKFSYRYTDRALISAFVERWQPETNTFHMPFGEMTVTLDDVQHILGIPLTGTCLYGEAGGARITADDAANLLVQGLGVSKREAEKETKKALAVRLDWIKKVCAGTTEKSTEKRKQCCARGYLLFLLGYMLFPEKTGNKVSVYYLQSLMDLHTIGKKAWGMGVLAYLYRHLGLASRAYVKQVSGYLTLLQAWIYEHFNIRRPGLYMKYLEDMPRMHRWLSQPSPGDSDSALVVLREQLDDLDAREVIWDPYQNRRAMHPLHEVAWYHGILICYDVAEVYYPDRVLRQFERVQIRPRKPMKALKENRGKSGSRYKVYYDMEKWYVENWESHVLSRDRRSMPVCHPWDCSPGYMKWFKTVSHIIIQNPANRLSKPMRVPMQHEEKVENVIIKVSELLVATIKRGTRQDISKVLTTAKQVNDMLLGAICKSSGKGKGKRVHEEEVHSDDDRDESRTKQKHESGVGSKRKH